MSKDCVDVSKAYKYKFNSHKECEFFPCHDVSNPEEFNCLFCYCPLYPLGEECGGNYVYLQNGIKDCSNCLVPHGKNAYDYILTKSELILDLARKK